MRQQIQYLLKLNVTLIQRNVIRCSSLFKGAEELSQSPPHHQTVLSPSSNNPPTISGPLQQLQASQPVSSHQMQAYQPQMTQTYQQSFVNQVSFIKQVLKNFFYFASLFSRL
jgi:hypothetical protein